MQCCVHKNGIISLSTQREIVALSERFVKRQQQTELLNRSCLFCIVANENAIHDGQIVSDIILWLDICWCKHIKWSLHWFQQLLALQTNCSGAWMMNRTCAIFDRMILDFYSFIQHPRKFTELVFVFDSWLAKIEMWLT